MEQLKLNYTKHKNDETYCKFLVKKYEEKIGVKVDRLVIRKFKGYQRWGMFRIIHNVEDENEVHINSDLFKVSKKALEYVVGHELVHIKVGPKHKHDTWFKTALILFLGEDLIRKGRKDLWKATNKRRVEYRAERLGNKLKTLIERR